MVLPLGGAGPVQSSVFTSGGPHLRAGLERQGSTLRADLSGLGTAQAVAVERYVDGRIGLDMQCTGALDQDMRGYVYKALIASAYGLNAVDDQATVDRLVDGDAQLRAGFKAFMSAGSGVTLRVAIPQL